MQKQPNKPVQTLDIVAGDYTGFIKRIAGLGFAEFSEIVWVQMPCRINGRWRAKLVLP